MTKLMRLADIARSADLRTECETAAGTFLAGPLNASDLTAVISRTAIVLRREKAALAAAEAAESFDPTNVEVNKETTIGFLTKFPEIGAMVIARGMGEPDLEEAALDLPGGSFLVLLNHVYEATVGEDKDEANFIRVFGKRVGLIVATMKARQASLKSKTDSSN